MSTITASGIDRHTAERLADLAVRLTRLRPDWANADRFFEQRSELVADLRRLARGLVSP